MPGYSARLSRQIVNILKGLNVEASLQSESIAGKCHVQEVAWTADWCFLLVSVLVACALSLYLETRFVWTIRWWVLVVAYEE